MTHTDDDHKDHGPVIVITTSVLTFVALLFVIARIASRRISGRKLAVDDHLVVICIVRSSHLHWSPVPSPGVSYRGKKENRF